jgi:hypothetical protein
VRQTAAPAGICKMRQTCGTDAPPAPKPRASMQPWESSVRFLRSMREARTVSFASLVFVVQPCAQRGNGIRGIYFLQRDDIGAAVIYACCQSFYLCLSTECRWDQRLWAAGTLLGKEGGGYPKVGKRIRDYGRQAPSGKKGGGVSTPKCQNGKN